MNDDSDDRPAAKFLIAAPDGLRFVPRNHHSVWMEKYRPKTISECVLPMVPLKAPLLNYVANRGGPHLLLVGPPGVGKSSVARAIGNELCWHTLIVNGSLHASMNAMRGDISEFVTETPMLFYEPRHRCVLFEEADQMKPAVQAATHGWLEDYGSGCTFIFATNHPDLIAAPIKSRCLMLDFDYSTEPARSEMYEGFRNRLREILAAEQVQCSDRIIEDRLNKDWPDFRQMLNQLQMRKVM
jgi:DNA polymerase III delta prime subunit